jgi:hypothetical protein
MLSRRLLAVWQSRNDRRIVHIIVDRLVYRIDLRTQRLWIVMRSVRARFVEGSVEHPNDLRGLVRNDCLAFCVPTNGCRDTARELGRSFQIDFGELSEAVAPVADPSLVIQFLSVGGVSLKFSAVGLGVVPPSYQIPSMRSPMPLRAVLKD